MPTVITPIRSDNAYFGFAKESSPGTAVSPAIFPRWMDGSNIEIDAKMEDIWEGDGSRRLSTIIKNQQIVKIKLVATLRPIELGFFEVAAQGSGSDSYTAPTTNTTMSSSSSAGATTISIAANTGLTASGTAALVIGAGTASEEIAIFTTPVSGSGPYTLTVNSSYNGGALKLAHSSASTVQSAAQHVITDQTDGNYYTVEVGLGTLFSAGGTTLRVRDCKVETFKRSAKAGGLLMHEIEFVGIATTSQGSAATVTLEQHAPFLFTQSSWTLDGSTSGDAPNLKSFDITQKDNLDTGIQTEALTLAAIIFGRLNVDIGFDVVFTTASRIYLTYFGSTSGTTDAQALGLGSLTVTFTQPDTLQTVTYSILTLAYTKVTKPVPKTDGKHFEMKVSGTSIAAPLSGVGSNNTYLLQTTLNNTQYSAY